MKNNITGVLLGAKLPSKNLNMIMRTLILVLVCTFSPVMACFSVGNEKNNLAEMPFSFEVVKGSREVVMVQDKPWEEQMMAYYKVLKTDGNLWQMWYSAWNNERRDDYSDFLTYAHSADGRNWIKQIPGKENNILRGTGHPNRDGIVEQDVFIEPDADLKYRMIYTARDETDGFKEKTFIEESPDGINWSGRRVLWNRKHDSQFSVIQKNDLYYIYLRYWEVHKGIRYRTIGLAITDKDWNIVREPVNVLKADFDSDYPHLYNPAASKISDRLDIMFPTYFNEHNDRIKVCIAYMYMDRGVLTDIDITEDLFAGEDINWAIAMPGLVKDGKNTWWLYYYGTDMSHSKYLDKSREFKYYRIKLKIREY